MESTIQTTSLKLNSISENDSSIESIFERGHKRKKYENFSETQLETLNEWFSKSIYPKIEDFDLISNETQQPKKKIQNWFKYKRRLAVLDNESKIPQYKTKKVLSPKVFETLKNYFKENQNPTLKEFRDIAKSINLKEKQIISWFTYRRRKLKLQRIQKKDKKSNENTLQEDNESYKRNLYEELPSKMIHLNTNTGRKTNPFVEFPCENTMKYQMNYYQQDPCFSIKKEVPSYPSFYKAPISWPFMNNNIAYQNFLQNNFINNNMAYKYSCMQNSMSRNLNNMNTSMFYNKMAPKMNFMPNLLKENITNMGQNAFIMNNMMGVKEKIEVKHESL